MRALAATLLTLALAGCGGPPAMQIVSTLKTALDTKCVAARLLDMDDICPQQKEPGPEPARFCYRTIGTIDCYEAPEAELRRRNVVVASPAIEAPED